MLEKHPADNPEYSPPDPSAGLLQITVKEFQLISRLIYERFGINLTDKKVSLVQGRLNKLVRAGGYKNFREYYDSVVADPTGKSLLQLVDKISTNHTFFFREQEHFNLLKQLVLPELLASGETAFKIWCAGCATGEEAYSLSIVMQEFFQPVRLPPSWSILATDISLSALEKAIQGIYPRERVKEIPPTLLHRYFQKQPDGNFCANQTVRRPILFKRLNLIQEAYPFKGQFQLIFLRNVMIYFDRETRNRIINNIMRYMSDGAFLFLGHAETLGRSNTRLRYIKPAVYRKI